MNKRTLAWLLAPLLLALIVSACLLADYARLDAGVREKRLELAESRQTWEDIAAEKESLQKELKGVRDDLKEAELSLSESAERAEQLRQDIAALEGDIASLRQQLTSSSEEEPNP